MEIVVEKLIKYPDIKFIKKNNNKELIIFSHDNNGFDILLQMFPKENTLYFGNFHWHFKNTEEMTNAMLNQLIFGLTGIVRVKEFSKNSKAYKWTLQIQDREGKWLDTETTGLMNFNFWTKTDIKYLQNNLLPKDILHSGS